MWLPCRLVAIIVVCLAVGAVAGEGRMSTSFYT